MEPRNEQHRFLKEAGKRFKGTRLSIVGEATPPAQATLQLLQQEFVPLTGIEVQWDQQPLDRVLAMVSTDTALQRGAYDIYYLDGSWLGHFVKDTANIQELLQRSDLAYPDYDFGDILEPLVKYTASYQGWLMGIPFDIPIHIMLYRRDIFEKMRLPLPRTMAEYMEVAKIIDSKSAPRLHGTTGMWKSGHYSLLIDFSTYLWVHGGSFYGREGKSAVNDAHALAAAEYMLELGHYMPPEVTTWDWYGEVQSFAQGQSALLIHAGEWVALFDDPAHSKVVGLVEAAPCPREFSLRPQEECSFDEKPGSSRQGGSCLAISRYSKNIDAAWVFLQWATSADVTTRASTLGGGGSPIRRSNYSDPRILERKKVMPGSTRCFDVTLDAILHRMGSEPHMETWTSIVPELTVELGKMTTGQQSAQVTLDKMALIMAVFEERRQRPKQFQE
ncbi:extracellular solute-binding protein [Vitiosangium sp. GDMCC 1.1324]|uniref:extracellular solute-binding protein n=1 Tax=Vitiosangium sp. (strain GDMCC 1.1324) TaxID=2138576 RepID=UPI00130D5120|nr:extracellular solute-binding protein [Vitiosangium sp. GDMCC 1.1324]